MQQEAAREREMVGARQAAASTEHTGKLPAALRTSLKLSHTHIFTHIKYLPTKEDLLCESKERWVLRNLIFTMATKLSWDDTAALGVVSHG